MRKHTRATPAGVPRGRSKFTRARRRRMRCMGYIVRRPLGFVFDTTGMKYITVAFSCHPA